MSDSVEVREEKQVLHPDPKRQQRKQIKVLDIAKFYIPLSLTTFMIMISHNAINAGIARTANPAIGLAAFRIAKSLTTMIENPVFMVPQTAVSLVNGPKSFRFMRRTFLLMSACIAGILAIFALPGPGTYVFSHVFSASPITASSARLSMVALFALPIVSANRNMYQGVAILTHQTRLIPFASALRLVVIVGLMFILSKIGGISGALMGGILFLAGVTTESVVNQLFAKGSVKDIVRHQPDTEVDGDLTHKAIFAFFLPLVLTSAVNQFTIPVVNTRIGLGFSVRPEIAIAAFSTGLDLSQLFLSPINMLHQAAMMFGTDQDPHVRKVLRYFIGIFLAFLLVIMGTVAFGGIGRFILETVIGVSVELADRAIWVVRIMLVLVVVRGYREYIWGICMKERNTKVISTARSVALGIIIATVFLGVRFMDWYPSAVVAFAIALSEIVETILILISAKKGNHTL